MFFDGHNLIGDHDVYLDLVEARVANFDSLPLNVAFNCPSSRLTAKSSSEINQTDETDKSEGTSSCSGPHVDLVGHREALKALSDIYLINLMVERVRAWDAEHSSLTQDLKKERENTIAERRKVFEEREKVKKEKERVDREKKRVEEVEIKLKRLKEEKFDLEIKLKEAKDSVQIKVNDAIIEYRDSNELYENICESEQFKPLRQALGSVAGKQAFFKLRKHCSNCEISSKRGLLVMTSQALLWTLMPLLHQILIEKKRFNL
ncbi:hypothetical protein NE237_002785 [Protea cynaroides]|uniref:Uncharacterized protein n=1 Tax=Protea cynaroides TaxID=273540 RepID=A0A9Q0KFU1_9MAGN|nr:hypothetical protein NE237_002785 [Protea cynaroides]